MESALSMYRRKYPAGPVDMDKLVACTLVISKQNDRYRILRINIIQELKARQHIRRCHF